jgi:hypothetical protein
MSWEFENAKYDLQAEEWIQKPPDEGTVAIAQVYATLAQAAAIMHLSEVLKELADRG